MARDPLLLALGLGLLAGALGAVLVRRGARLGGALLAALVGASAGALAPVAYGVPFAPQLPLAALAASAAALCAWLLPGSAGPRAGLGRAFGRAAFAGAVGEARLRSALFGAAPSRLVDAADALRLERAVLDAEAKSGAAIALALVRHADVYDAARWRAAGWLAALALAAAGAFAPPSPRLALAAAAAGALLGFAAAQVPRVRRFFSSEAALGARAEARALDAFARAGLARAPGDAGVLLFAALFEGRVLALADRGVADSPGAWDEVARRAAAGLADDAPADGLARAIDAAGAAARAAQTASRARHGGAGAAATQEPALRPPAVVIED
ncbi:MAG TPA: hypothetical protein VHQ66_04525 [Myxococcota bacterium]|nr:hypothetical protein [Myxococcota bacterium]